MECDGLPTPSPGVEGHAMEEDGDGEKEGDEVESGPLSDESYESGHLPGARGILD